MNLNQLMSAKSKEFFALNLFRDQFDKSSESSSARKTKEGNVNIYQFCLNSGESPADRKFIVRVSLQTTNISRKFPANVKFIESFAPFLHLGTEHNNIFSQR